MPRERRCPRAQRRVDTIVDAFILSLAESGDFAMVKAL